MTDDHRDAQLPAGGTGTPGTGSPATVKRRWGWSRGRTLALALALALLVIAVLGRTVFRSGSPATTTTGAAAGTGAGSGTGATSRASGPAGTALEPLPFRSAPVNVTTEGFLSWALMDRRTGEVVGSPNLDQVSSTASMVKAWLAADYLRRATEAGQTPSQSRLHTIEIMIRDSDNQAAYTIYGLNGGTESINRLINMCGLTDAHATDGSWSKTYVSARDTVRMGDCIANGTAAGPTWTNWLLEQMREVRGDGDFGPRKALSASAAAQVAIKNGWLLRDEDKLWHVSSLAIGDDWVLAVLQRYPSHGDYNADFAHTQQVAQEVASQLLNPDVQ